MTGTVLKTNKPAPPQAGDSSGMTLWLYAATSAPEGATTKDCPNRGVRPAWERDYQSRRPTFIFGATA